MAADQSGRALAGWLLARSLLQHLVLAGVVERANAVDIIDHLLLVLEEHQAALPEEGAAISHARTLYQQLLPALGTGRGRPSKGG